MTNQDFSITFSVDQTPEAAFAAIQNVRGWWSETVEGGTERLGDTFVYRHGDLHASTQQLVEVVPGQKMVWLVTDAALNFTKDKGEWKGTRPTFEVWQSAGKTHVRFTHVGLVRPFECYDACSKAWTFYVKESLRGLIATGKGQPDRKG